jgi:hypothetical protein
MRSRECEFECPFRNFANGAGVKIDCPSAAFKFDVVERALQYCQSERAQKRDASRNYEARFGSQRRSGTVTFNTSVKANR